jgi:hypothetical protein
MSTSTGFPVGGFSGKEHLACIGEIPAIPELRPQCPAGPG